MIASHYVEIDEASVCTTSTRAAVCTRNSRLINRDCSSRRPIAAAGPAPYTAFAT
jgi:hypothetical protein